MLPAAKGDPLVELRERKRRWPRMPAFEELRLWRTLDSRARDYEVAAVIEYDQTDHGPDNVTVSAVLDGVGVRWQLLPAGTSGDRPEAHTIEVHSRDGRPVGQRLLTRLGLGRVHEALTLGLATSGAALVLGERWGAVVAPKPGRRGRGDLYYAEVAYRYVRALRSNPRAPIPLVLAELEAQGEPTTADQLKARLRRARKRGLLTAAPPGRPGGELTDEALALLREVGLTEGNDDGER